MQESHSFAVGDVVLLASGGPKMTVAGVSDTVVNCTWFSDSIPHRGEFPPECLRNVHGAPAEDAAGLAGSSASAGICADRNSGEAAPPTNQ